MRGARHPRLSPWRDQVATVGLPGALAGRPAYKELGRARAKVHDGIARVRARRTRDLLSDRGMMGDGVIELRRLRGWVEQAGYAGYSEVEIFSEIDWWKRSGDEVLDTCIARHRSVV